MRTILLFTILLLCLSLCFTKTKKLASSQRSHKAAPNAGKTTNTGTSTTSAAATSTSTSASSTATTTAAATATSSSSTESSSTVCNNSQKILNRQLNAYVTVEQGDNSSRVLSFPQINFLLISIRFRSSAASRNKANGAL